MGVIAVTLNAPNDWSDHATLLDYGFSQLETHELYTPTDIFKVSVANTNEDLTVAFTPPTATLLPEQFDKVTFKAEMERFLFAPIKKGEKLGSVTYYIDGKQIASAYITAANGVTASPAKKIKKDYIYWLRVLFGAIYGRYNK